MKLIFIALLGILNFSSPEWLVDFGKAKEIAKRENKYILLNFSGSDWCGPCIQMHKELFQTQTFKEFASSRLVLVVADFPRMKKHALSQDQQQRNEQLADTYNKKGIFPLTVLLNEEGKIIYAWEGKPEMSPNEFKNQVENLIHAAQ